MADSFAVVGLIALCCVLLPLCGWWLASRLPGDPLFRFTAACLAGVTILAVAELIVYTLSLPQAVAVTLVAVSCAVSLRPVSSAIRRREFAWDALMTWAGASAILAAATLRYAVHGAGTAAWDWYEHWLRSLIFLTQAPVTTSIGIYVLPARGPLFNGAAAFLLHLAGSAHYWVFQIIATTFNVLVCLPFAMFLTTVCGLGRRAALPVAAVVTVLLPFYFWENTYTWTKDLTAAFVLLGIHEYLVAYRKGSRDGMALSLAYLAPGFLCHYLALLYALMLGLHLLLVIPVRTLPIRALNRAGLVWVVLIAPWFTFMFLSFGVHRTLEANTSVGGYYAASDARGRPIPPARVWVANLCADLLPSSICRPLLPSPGPATCAVVTVDGASVARGTVPCPTGAAWDNPYFAWNGIYAVLGYSGLLVVLLTAAGSVARWLRHFRRAGLRAIRGAQVGHDAWFLLWVLTAGLVFNLIPINWFDARGSFNENLHAWFLVFLTVTVKGFMRLPRLSIAVLALAMAGEFAAVDLKIVQLSSVVLPLPNHELAMRGHPLLGELLPTPISGARFQAPANYYRNYLHKIRGGAVYFRDIHPDNFAAVSGIVLALGLLSVVAGRRPVVR